MRIDVLSIFPDYLAPLELSLPGKAKAKGLLELHVHDLRQWATDKHHKTDDTPYGGGAGMVMKPEPFGEAFDALDVTEHDTIIFTTPSGDRFDQRKAEELSARPRLIFACGRYEGIDQRVIEHAREIAHVEEISLGDYVLNGGEVAALAITEAVVRLIPGFMGNPDSLVEESHEDGLLEYPVYTKPKEWRGREVPDVLLSGDHGKVAAWRHEQRVRRTAERRPDLLHRAETGEWQIGPATASDAGELLTLTRACAVQEAVGAGTLALPPLQETVDDVRAVITGDEWQVWVARSGGRLVGSVRGRLIEGLWEVARFMVAPDLQGRGLGRLLLEHAERSAAPEATAYVLGVLEGSEANLRRYKRAGYRVMGAATVTDGVALVPLAKRRR